jgi:hypothetical protein
LLLPLLLQLAPAHAARAAPAAAAPLAVAALLPPAPLAAAAAVPRLLLGGPPPRLHQRWRQRRAAAEGPHLLDKGRPGGAGVERGLDRVARGGEGRGSDVVGVKGRDELAELGDLRACVFFRFSGFRRFRVRE